MPFGSAFRTAKLAGTEDCFSPVFVPALHARARRGVFDARQNARKQRPNAENTPFAVFVPGGTNTGRFAMHWHKCAVSR